ncbi:MAG: entericidin A/B family lipoprotein [Rugosibacter sp.]|jgi:entericidin B|nr:entericidin A/B family lipoprotein [Rugosibacter sp.]MDO9272488.1 entericidin A/B family lipoprotein [Rugosibacter sp.]
MMKKIFASLLATLFLASTVLTLSACNTVEGAGKDIEKGGQAIKNEANEHKN